MGRIDITVFLSGASIWLNKVEFCLDFEVLIHYIMLRRGGLYDKSRYHLRSF